MSNAPRLRGGALLHVVTGVVLLAFVPKLLPLLATESVAAASEAAVPAAATTESPATPVPTPAAATASPSPRAVTPAPTSADRAHELELPDGTFVPALNGAVDAAPLSMYWGNWPWSKIVGVERGEGIDWYRHEDGSYSTTQMVWRSDLGRELAMTRVAHPGPAAPPVAPDDAKLGR